MPCVDQKNAFAEFQNVKHNKMLQKERETERQKDIQAEIHWDKRNDAERQRDKTNLQKDRNTERQRDRKTIGMLQKDRETWGKMSKDRKTERQEK